MPRRAAPRTQSLPPAGIAGPRQSPSRALPPRPALSGGVRAGFDDELQAPAITRNGGSRQTGADKMDENWFVDTSSDGSHEETVEQESKSVPSWLRNRRKR